MVSERGMLLVGQMRSVNISCRYVNPIRCSLCFHRFPEASSCWSIKI
ncbi:hypothetical protein Hanom_Chr06g00558051 [Helianthus anomalus]